MYFFKSTCDIFFLNVFITFRKTGAQLVREEM